MEKYSANVIDMQANDTVEAKKLAEREVVLGAQTKGAIVVDPANGEMLNPCDKHGKPVTLDAKGYEKQEVEI